MLEPVDDVRISEESGDASRVIETELVRTLRNALPQADNVSFVLSARDAEGRIVGGLKADTSYGWLLVKVLWVDEACRGRSLGHLLMNRAEERARAVGCHGAWLDTSNPDAMQFYTKLGYTPFGCLANRKGQRPEGHRRWFMQKML